jgi:predicted dehydrogenase
VPEGKNMIRAAKDAGKKLFVVKQNRFNPPIQVVKSLLDEGKLGLITGFQVNCFWNRSVSYYNNNPWRGTLSLDGGILFTQFSHFIDILYWFLGDIDKVNGWRANISHQGIIEFEDTGVASIVMKNGATGTLHYTINTFDSNMEGSFTLFGEKGTVKIGGQYLNTIEYFQVENEQAPGLLIPSQANQYGSYQGSMSNHHLVYKQLVASLNNIGHPLVEAGEALKTIEMIRQIYESSPFVHAMQKKSAG